MKHPHRKHLSSRDGIYLALTADASGLRGRAALAGWCGVGT